MMNKEDMIHILNQHGLDVLYDVISDEVVTSYDKGFNCGYIQGCDASRYKAYDEGYDKGFEDGEHVGWCDCYDMLSDDD